MDCLVKPGNDTGQVNLIKKWPEIDGRPPIL
jgi:hypothetical protein